MPNSSSPPPSTSIECLLGDPKPKEAPPPDSSALKVMPSKQKKTREIPNLSDCHGCSCRINYSNPKERLQPLDSFWRIVLLCKKCRKQVNDGKLCTYCFKDTSKSISDCFTCGNCCRLVHNNCIVNYEKSPPWSYCSSKVVCIDCWMPDKLKRSIRVRKEKRGKKVVPMSVTTSNAHGKLSGKGNGGGRSLVDVATEAKCALEKKVAVALKAKETALRKAVIARNALELARNALDLVVTRCENAKKEGLVGSSGNGSSSSDSTRVVGDAEFALQLHHAMNSSPRRLKKICPVNYSCSDLLKVSDSFCENGKIAGYSNTLENRVHDGNISMEPTFVEANGSFTFTDSGELKPDVVTFKCNNRKRKELQRSGTEASRSYTSTDSYTLKPELVTYKRYSRKRKECQPSVLEANGSFTCNVKGKEGPRSGLDANGSCNSTDGLNAEIITYKRNKRKRNERGQLGERGNLGNGDGSIANDTHAEYTSLVRESQSSLQDKSKEELCGDDGRSSTPEGCFVNGCAEDRISISIAGNTYSDSYSLKYSRRTKASGILQDSSSNSHPDIC